MRYPSERRHSRFLLSRRDRRLRGAARDGAAAVSRAVPGAVARRTPTGSGRRSTRSPATPRSPRPTPLVTRVTEREVNAYLAYDATPQLPGRADRAAHHGPAEPRACPGPRLVDLDAVRKQRQSRGWLDPLNYLGGTLAGGRVGPARGHRRAGALRPSSPRSVGGVPVPKVVVQELVTYYSKTDANPRRPEPRRPLPAARPDPRDRHPAGRGPRQAVGPWTTRPSSTVRCAP